MERWGETDSGWVGAGEDDDLDRQLLEEDDGFDRGQPHALTALGPVDPGALGVTLAAERVGGLALAPTPGAEDGRHEMLAELEDVHSSGVRAVAVEVADAAELPVVHWLAGRVPPHLVLFAPPELALDPVPGMSEIGGVLVGADPAPETLARIAASRLPVRAGSVAAAGALLGAGVEPARISVALASPDEARFAGLAKDDAGPTLVIPAPADGDAAPWARAVAGLVSSGWGERLAVASGIGRPEEMLARGGPRGMGWAMAHLPLALMEAGLDAMTVRALFIDNPMRMLTIDPGAE